MVIGQAQPACRDGLSRAGSSPVRPLKDNRCASCRLLDPSTDPTKYCLTTCPHLSDFTPTPNPFGILTGLQQSPDDVKWPFEFVPARTSRARRRGRRGGKRHKVKRPAPTCRAARKSDSISELCQKIVALRLHDDAPEGESVTSKSEEKVNLTPPVHV
ncbi:hypothetical protein FB567DRAFT_217697 [Paraphoma chrysanthemicola]|uniref:Uncharacterized protein n=1 Tax=Paraphoma chrysanthemicola TaxID=798071 RepID=A0A8K0QUD9_9PLEO|nr:hypothetical protein FB567DRAFT_217697 [Paraphoma chrysanthemicola]